MSSFTDNFKHVPVVTTVLIAINVLIYIALPLVPDGAAYYDMGVLTPAALLAGEWWTLLTSMFLHSGLMHIACNMISLYYLGVMCERVFGKMKFLLLYFLSGIAGGLAYVAVNLAAGDVMAGAVGASGAIFGLFGAYGYLLLRERKNNKLFVYKPSASDVQAYIVMLVANLAIGFSPGSNIANEAHIGGMVCGFVVGMILYAIVTRNLPSAQQRAMQQQQRQYQQQYQQPPQQQQYPRYGQQNQNPYRNDPD